MKNIKHLSKTTLIDFPLHVAATIFFGGCNFCCPYCYNPDLIYNHKDIPDIPKEEVLTFLEKRKHVLDGVALTGGEPTIQVGLKDFIKEIKNLGYKVKLDTNGYRPDVLKDLVSIVDYVAMDIKSSLNDYDEITGVKIDQSKILESIGLVKTFKNYEFRTTVWKGLFSVNEFKNLLTMVNAKEYYLQNFYVLGGESFSPVTKEIGESYQQVGKETGVKVFLRGKW